MAELEEKLLSLKPTYHGQDHQIDTYYNVKQGRLKLREGNIENALIYYERPNTAEAKQSNIILYQHKPDSALQEILEKVSGIKVVVDKKRNIYFIENVKFHFDTVEGLGTFIEAEAIDADGSIGIDKLKEQCAYYFNFFNLHEDQYVDVSYSDLMLGL